jgi:hypothetical protein
MCADGPGDADWRRPLYDGFEGRDFSPAGGLYYKANPEQNAGTVEFQSDVTYRGRGALKLTVRQYHGNALEHASDRAEVWEKPALWAPYDEGVWYGFAVKFAEPIPRDNHRYLIAQWKRQIAGTIGDFSPFLALRLNRGKLFATVETNLVTTARIAPKGEYAHCGDGEAAVWQRPETNQSRILVATDETWTRDDGRSFNACTRETVVTRRGNPLPKPGTGWIDFVVYSLPGPDGSGHIELYANGKWVATVTGRIGHSEKGLGSHQYFKFGPYRAAHDNSWTLYYDEFRRSPNRTDVVTL